MNPAWIEVSLGDVLRLEYGKPLDERERKPDGRFPIYGANGEKARTDRFYYDKPSIIVGRKGSAGEVNLTEDKFWPLDVTYFVTFDETQHHLRFFYYLLSSLDLPKLAKGVKPGINREEVYSQRARVPSYAEQRRIVGILDEAFEGIAKAIANAERNLRTAEVLFGSQLESVFICGNAWPKRPLGEMCERITKGSSPRWQGIAYVDKPGVIFVTSENVGEYQILLDKPKYVEEAFNTKDKKSILKKGDVLTNIVGASIGRTAVFDGNELANINQAVCLIRCEPDKLNNFFLTHLLNSPVFKRVLHDNEVDNARANLSLTFFSNLRIPAPSLDEQSKIVIALDALRKETQLLESIYQQKLAALNALKKSLLHQAFTGQL